MTQQNRLNLVLAGWLLVNYVSVGLVTFSQNFALRVIGWGLVSTAIGISGLVSIGALFGGRENGKNGPT